MSQIITVQPNNNSNDWEPVIGSETLELLKSKNFVNPDNTLNQAGERILNETKGIMKACGNPNLPYFNETGIVLGYVQSGKTLSFTTLAAMAKDNLYQVVIVIAGISTNLVNQSTKRLEEDLRLQTRADRKWTLLKNPTVNQNLRLIETTLMQWSDATFPRERCKTLLIMVMKNASHLDNLYQILRLQNLDSVPVLIIDDEGDQASLNTQARWAARNNIDIENISEADVSTIYRRITTLRSIFNHHTFLQYTATPQANLFINILDRLSPNFIKLLTPGNDYTGGITFFRENPHLIKLIPPSEIPSTNNPIDEIPESLKSALRIFFLGVVAGQLSGGKDNRTMLVHPSRLQDNHNEFAIWIENTLKSWHRLISGSDNQDKLDLLNEFRSSYDELSTTVSNLPPFEDLVGINLVQDLKYTQVLTVNSSQGSTPQVSWKENYSWILVGGQSMDRGFTVQGLTVTYMPRSIGGGNVDTIQQRARFFGYKRSYLGYCRVYLDQNTIDSYTYNIGHEEDVRAQLGEYDLNNGHLNNWSREVVLNRMLNLTRRNILYDRLERDEFGNGWFKTNAPHDTEALIIPNFQSVLEFISSNRDEFTTSTGHPDRTNDQKHLFAKIPLKNCLDTLLNKLRYTRESDSNSFASLKSIIKNFLIGHSDVECVVYLMGIYDLNDISSRTRKLNSKDEIQQLFQGKNPKSGTTIYPGDSEIRDSSLLTIQIHLLNLRDTEYENVTALAIWMPEVMSVELIRQV